MHVSKLYQSRVEWGNMIVMNGKSIPERKSRLPWRAIGGRAVIIEPGRGEVNELNEVATFLWHQTDGLASIDDISKRVVDEFDTSHDEAVSDAIVFFGQMAELGLVVLKDPELHKT
jgi:hypothetical protein